MSETQQAAFLISQAACAMIEAMGMQAENDQRKAVGHSMAYTEDAFVGVIEKYGIHHNAAILTLRDNAAGAGVNHD
jgi:acyl-coenzyme A thioesterase PaaI-like protein